MTLSEDSTLEKLLVGKLLSVRAYNACNRQKVRNIYDLCKYYRVHGSFLSFRNLGAKTNLELIKFVGDFLSGHWTETSQTVESLQTGHEQHNDSLSRQFFQLNSQQKLALQTIYFKFREQLSRRAQNTIESMCEEDTLRSWLKNLDKITYDFSQLYSVGEKTEKELKSFISKLQGSIISPEFAILSREHEIAALSYDLTKIVGVIPEEFSSFLSEHFKALGTGEYPLLELFDLLFKADVLCKPKYRELLQTSFGFYHDISEVPKQELAQRLGVSVERVRQLQTSHSIHLSALERIQAVIEVFLRHGLQIPSRLILSTKPYHLCKFEWLNNITTFSNKFLSQILVLINPGYQLLKTNCSGNVQNLVIANWVEERFRIQDFLSKIEEITEVRIDESFEVSFKGFVYQFLRQELTFNELEALSEVVKEIIFDFYDLYPDDQGFLTISRNTKKKTWEYIVDVLKENGEPMHIDDIAVELQKLGFDIDGARVRPHTLKNQQFVLSGGSIYGLKEWEEGGQIAGGTIKQLVEKCLNASSEPMHLYDISKYVTKYRETSVSSIYSNIQSDPQKKFRLIGELFFGLANKIYSPSSLNIQPISRQWFLEVERIFDEREVNVLKKSEIIQYVAQTLAVKTVQVEYLLEERIKKGDLLELSDKTLQLA